jgi:hypothetical protein
MDVAGWLEPVALPFAVRDVAAVDQNLDMLAHGVLVIEDITAYVRPAREVLGQQFGQRFGGDVFGGTFDMPLQIRREFDQRPWTQVLAAVRIPNGVCSM